MVLVFRQSFENRSKSRSNAALTSVVTGPERRTVDIQNKVDIKNLVNKVREYEIAISIIDLTCGLNSLNITPTLIIDEKKLKNF